MGRITSRKIERPPLTSIAPPKVKRFSLHGCGSKCVVLQPGESVTIGRDVLVKNNGNRAADILVVAPRLTAVSDQDTVALVES